MRINRFSFFLLGILLCTSAVYAGTLKTFNFDRNRDGVFAGTDDVQYWVAGYDYGMIEDKTLLYILDHVPRSGTLKCVSDSLENCFSVPLYTTDAAATKQATLFVLRAFGFSDIPEASPRASTGIGAFFAPFADLFSTTGHVTYEYLSDDGSGDSGSGGGDSGSGGGDSGSGGGDSGSGGGDSGSGGGDSGSGGDGGDSGGSGSGGGDSGSGGDGGDSGSGGDGGDSGSGDGGSESDYFDGGFERYFENYDGWIDGGGETENYDVVGEVIGVLDGLVDIDGDGTPDDNVLVSCVGCGDDGSGTVDEGSDFYTGGGQRKQGDCDGDGTVDNPDDLDCDGIPDSGIFEDFPPILLVDGEPASELVYEIFGYQQCPEITQAARNRGCTVVGNTFDGNCEVLCPQVSCEEYDSPSSYCAADGVRMYEVCDLITTYTFGGGSTSSPQLTYFPEYDPSCGHVPAGVPLDLVEGGLVGVTDIVFSTGDPVTGGEFSTGGGQQRKRGDCDGDGTVDDITDLDCDGQRDEPLTTINDVSVYVGDEGNGIEIIFTGTETPTCYEEIACLPPMICTSPRREVSCDAPTCSAGPCTTPKGTSGPELGGYDPRSPYVPEYPSACGTGEVMACTQQIVVPEPGAICYNDPCAGESPLCMAPAAIIPCEPTVTHSCSCVPDPTSPPVCGEHETYYCNPYTSSVSCQCWPTPWGDDELLCPPGKVPLLAPGATSPRVSDPSSYTCIPSTGVSGGDGDGVVPDDKVLSCTSDEVMVCPSSSSTLLGGGSCICRSFTDVVGDGGTGGGDTGIGDGDTAVCPAVSDPVCGADGNVYSNACFAALSGQLSCDSYYPDADGPGCSCTKPDPKTCGAFGWDPSCNTDIDFDTCTTGGETYQCPNGKIVARPCATSPPPQVMALSTSASPSVAYLFSEPSPASLLPLGQASGWSVSASPACAAQGSGVQTTVTLTVDSSQSYTVEDTSSGGSSKVVYSAAPTSLPYNKIAREDFPTGCYYADGGPWGAVGLYGCATRTDGVAQTQADRTCSIGAPVTSVSPGTNIRIDYHWMNGGTMSVSPGGNTNCNYGQGCDYKGYSIIQPTKTTTYRLTPSNNPSCAFDYTVYVNEQPPSSFVTRVFTLDHSFGSQGTLSLKVGNKEVAQGSYSTPARASCLDNLDKAVCGNKICEAGEGNIDVCAAQQKGSSGLQPLAFSSSSSIGVTSSPFASSFVPLATSTAHPQVTKYSGTGVCVDSSYAGLGSSSVTFISDQVIFLLLPPAFLETLDNPFYPGGVPSSDYQLRFSNVASGWRLYSPGLIDGQLYFDGQLILSGQTPIVPKGGTVTIRSVLASGKEMTWCLTLPMSSTPSSTAAPTPSTTSSSTTTSSTMTPTVQATTISSTPGTSVPACSVVYDEQSAGYTSGTFQGYTRSLWQVPVSGTVGSAKKTSALGSIPLGFSLTKANTWQICPQGSPTSGTLTLDGKRILSLAHSACDPSTFTSGNLVRGSYTASSGEITDFCVRLPGALTGLTSGYGVASNEHTFSATYLGADQDRVGPWNAYFPDGGQDHHFVVQMNLQQAKTLVSATLTHSVQGEYWATADSSKHPLAFFFRGTQLNTAHYQGLGSYPEGAHQLDMFGAKASQWAGGYLDLQFADETVRIQIPVSGTGSSTAPANELTPLGSGLCSNGGPIYHPTSGDGKTTTSFITPLGGNLQFTFTNQGGQWVLTQTTAASIAPLIGSSYPSGMQVPYSPSYFSGGTHYVHFCLALPAIGGGIICVRPDPTTFASELAAYANDLFVETLYERLLLRPSDAGGKAYWIGLLQNGIQTRAQVVDGFLNSEEYLRLYQRECTTQLPVVETGTTSLCTTPVQIGSCPADCNPVQPPVETWSIAKTGVTCDVDKDQAATFFRLRVGEGAWYVVDAQGGFVFQGNGGGSDGIVGPLPGPYGSYGASSTLVLYAGTYPTGTQQAVYSYSEPDAVTCGDEPTVGGDWYTELCGETTIHGDPIWHNGRCVDSLTLEVLDLVLCTPIVTIDDDGGDGGGDDPFTCTTDYAPVCGADGKDYDNACIAEAVGGGVAFYWECKYSTNYIGYCSGPKRQSKLEWYPYGPESRRFLDFVDARGRMTAPSAFEECVYNSQRDEGEFGVIVESCEGVGCFVSKLYCLKPGVSYDRGSDFAPCTSCSNGECAALRIQNDDEPICDAPPICIAPADCSYSTAGVNEQGCQVDCGTLSCDDRKRDECPTDLYCPPAPKGYHYGAPILNGNGCPIQCGELIKDTLNEDDPTSCSNALICPVASPPFGKICTLEDNTYDTHGCLIGCGGLVCEDEPVLCPAVYDPVCGADGVTYGNACEAAKAEVVVASQGMCRTVTTTYCFPGFASPVCGADGINYLGACYAGQAGTTVACSGSCPCENGAITLTTCTDPVGCGPLVTPGITPLALPALCGDGICATDQGENTKLCPADCKSIAAQMCEKRNGKWNANKLVCVIGSTSIASSPNSAVRESVRPAQLDGAKKQKNQAAVETLVGRSSSSSSSSASRIDPTTGEELEEAGIILDKYDRSSSWRSRGSSFTLRGCIDANKISTERIFNWLQCVYLPRFLQE